MSIHHLDNRTRTDTTNLPLLVDANDAANLLGIGRTTFFALVKNGTVSRVRLGGCVRYSTADLLSADFWQAHKERILAGHVHDVFPYEREKRFRRAVAAPRAPAASRPAGMPLPAGVSSPGAGPALP